MEVQEESWVSLLTQTWRGEEFYIFLNSAISPIIPAHPVHVLFLPQPPVPHTHTMLPLCANYSSSCASSFPLLGIEPMAFPWVDKPSTALLPSDLPNIPLLDVSIFFNLFFKNFGNVCNVFIDPPQSLSTLQGQPHPPHSFPYSMCVSHLELKTSHSLPFDQF